MVLFYIHNSTKNIVYNRIKSENETVDELSIFNHNHIYKASKLAQKTDAEGFYQQNIYQPLELKKFNIEKRLNPSNTATNLKIEETIFTLSNFKSNLRSADISKDRNVAVELNNRFYPYQDIIALDENKEILDILYSTNSKSTHHLDRNLNKHTQLSEYNNSATIQNRKNRLNSKY